MLNRTLSANLNGLNLGTRTLANANLAGLNLVATSIVRHDHPRMRKDSMRVADAKLSEESSIRPSIRGFLPSGSPASSPAFTPLRPYPGEVGVARPEVVVACAVPAFAGASWPSMVGSVAWSRTLAQVQPCARQRSAMTRAESRPAATFASGG